MEARSPTPRESGGLRLPLALVALAALALATPAPSGAQTTAGPVSEVEATAWREDLDQFARIMVETHGDVDHSLPSAAFDGMVADLRTRIPTMARHEIIVGLQRIAAAIGDGHTSVMLFFDPDVGFHQLPIRLGWYAEGLFVESVRDDAGVPPGARLVAIGDVPVDSAIARVIPLISRDNDIWIRVMAPLMLGSPEILHAVGLSGDPGGAHLTFEADGRRLRARLAARPEPFVVSHALDAPMSAGWRDARDTSESASPLWLRHPGRIYWYEYVPEHRVLYIQYDAVANAPDGPGVAEFFGSALATMDEVPVDRVIVDIRSNSGGEGQLNTGVVRQFVQRRELDEAGRLFVVIGRRTFSAAQMLAHQFDQWTSAIFVGEPTGSSPQFWGDHRPIELANSHVAVSASPTWWQPGGPYDERDFLPPRLLFEPRFADYAANRDPGVEALLDPDADLLSVGPAVMRALARGDTAAAAAAARAWDEAPMHAFDPSTGGLNRLGYELLGAHRTDDALAVFRLNVAVHPDYANGWDSLGETLLRAGNHEAGIAAYRRAYELDPRAGNAAEVLGRVDRHGGKAE